MKFGLEGKVVVVTGGCGGLGAAFARHFAEAGADVALLDLNVVEDAAGPIRDLGRRCELVRCDLSDGTQVASAAATVLDKLGRCDVLVNNAAIFPILQPQEITNDIWRRTYAVNVDAPWLLSRAFAPGMIERGWGRIINIASIQFWTKMAIGAHYTSSKGAVIGLTRALADELGPHGITVNAIAPGVIATDAVKRSAVAGQLEVAAKERQAVKRIGVPNDLSGLAVFLASDQASFISAQTIAVDGGITRR